MKGLRIPLAPVVLVAVLGLGLFPAMVHGDEPYFPYGGGIVYGQILGFNIYNELIPVVWAEVSAWRDGEFVAKAYSMAGGYYELILPVGWYTLRVEEPGYEVESREIFVSSASASAINFVLELSGEPVYKPKPKPEPPPAEYTVHVAVSGLPPWIDTELYVDGALKEKLGDGEAVELTFKVGTSHNLTVRSLIVEELKRYRVDEPSIMVSASAIHEFKYEAEYLLRFNVKPEGVPVPSKPREGWYPAGAAVSTPEAPEVIEGPPGTRYRFKAWSVDGELLDGNPVEFRMDKPHILELEYSTEYQVTVSSPYGDPEGSGWYPAGSKAVISIQPSVSVNPLVRRVFQGWSGDYTGVEPTAEITVDRPMQITALWTIDYTSMIVLVALAAAGLAAAAVAVTLHRRRLLQT
ncbi:MAG: carboxypeptidase-like regulatory domain-containing protein [Candidatus Bathyarchaeia archaeon]